MTDVDQELLVAVLATLTDTIPEETVASVVTQWAQDSTRSLAELLKDQGGLDERQLQVLRRIVAAHWESCHHDLGRSLEAWSVATHLPDGRTEVEHVESRPQLGDFLARYLDRTPAQGSIEAEGAPGPMELPDSASDTRYQILRSHAKGGIGQVWVARDRELQREVALKKLQGRYADRGDLRARFLLEAEITGKLEHPGIVPVYSLGKDAEGRPFYAMRLIRGDSLAVTIQRFHEARKKAEAEAGAGESPPTWGIEFQAILRRFLDTCDTLAYAHSRGVIHRDLKPGNIMLGPYGETLVVDWGLAKIIDKPDAASGLSDDEPEPDDSGPTSSSDTRPGTSIGTPSYMSPEQARGDLDQIGPRSDVYSLGATLYELLTGVVPFRGDRAPLIIAAVLKGNLTSPFALAPSAPPPLVAVCRKAMAYEPEDRYETAGALARDLENWLGDEPVSAYPEGRSERLSRWIRRHRTWAYSAAAALVGLSLIALIAVAFVDAARRNAVEAHKEAEDNFSLAQAAVDEYLTKVSESTLLKEEDSLDMRRLRQELLQTALRYYQKFVEERKSDPRLRRQLGSAYHRVGIIRGEIDTPQTALEPLREARAVWDGLLEKAPHDLDLQAKRAQTLIQIGNVLAKIDRPREAMRSLEEAAEVLEVQTGLTPSNSDLLMELAACYSEMSAIQATQEQADGALASLAKAHRVLRRLIDQSPNEILYQRALAEVVNNQGFVSFKRLDYPKALEAFQESQAICLSLVDRAPPGPKPIRDLELLGISYYNIGNIQTHDGAFTKALASYDQSIIYRSALVEGHPSVPRFQVELGKSHREIAFAQHFSGRDADALDSLNRSRTILEPLVKNDPRRALFHNQLGRTLNNIGYIHDEQRDNRKAFVHFQEAVVEHRRAVAESVDAHEYKYFLAISLGNLGEQYVDLGDPTKSLPYFEESLQALRELLSVNPDNDEYWNNVVDSLSSLAALRRQLGEPARALDDLKEAGRMIESAVPTSTRKSSLQCQLSGQLVQQAGCLADQNELAKAEAVLEQAATLMRTERSQAGPADEPATRRGLSEALQDLARVRRLQGRPDASARAAAERLTLWNRANRDELATLASQAAARACLVGYGRAPLPPRGDAVRELFIQAAVDDFRLAWALGFRDGPRIRADHDLNAILDREPLRALRDDLDFPERPFAAP
ncbi:serine/threonine-protein kinase [Paludisphaera borealis]|uniref:Serine/threonine-protein kinase PknD n=1 Tax=Paludisphaera borealis TaxID=1387353 RepID=A0A1U7CUE0_9BACT|nr:serine/threonine-protein kinase [Paludisphaera borealis]APW62516.1 Serine/threonine-protein kinase PknD [Paludisphaera borealis]